MIEIILGLVLRLKHVVFFSGADLKEWKNGGSLKYFQKKEVWMSHSVTSEISKVKRYLVGIQVIVIRNQ